MCGICGIVRVDGGRVERDDLLHMAQLLSHRGPDRTAVHVAGAAGLGHTRLAVLDPEHGDQPMSNADGGVHVVFNGEIYNHRELRRSLRAPPEFEGHADTEVLIPLFEEHGPSFVEHLDGFFAIALWDEREKCLLLARDRLGKKPLFFQHSSRGLVFASELRSLLPALEEEPELDPRALDEVLGLRFADEARSGFLGIEKLRPGELLLYSNGRVERRRYWRAPVPRPESITLADAVEGLRERLDRAVAARLEADVPLGLLLSGGLDSTAVLESLCRQSSGRPRTFTVGFTRESESEAPLARRSAAYFETDHREFLLDEQDLLAQARTVLEHLDEPFGDPSLLPTSLICERARSQVTVCLGGDGGDELFGGYNRYARVLAQADRPPTADWARPLVQQLVDVLPPLVGKTSKLARHLRERLASPEGRYAASLVSIEAPLRAALHGPRLERVEAGALEARIAGQLAGEGDLTGRMMRHDLEHYLPGLILTKVDRASMQHSLEMRSPFLDHGLVEWAARLPTPLKLHGTARKHVLRESLRGRVPDEILTQPKRGFGPPLGRWFRNELRPLAEEHLRDSQLARDGWLNGTTITALLDAHYGRRRNLGEALWTLLALEVGYRGLAGHRTRRLFA